MTHHCPIITEIRVDTQQVFDQAVRRTLEVVKATPEASPDQHGLSVDEMDWAMEQIRKARAQVALTLNRMSKRIEHHAQAEEVDCDTLIFRVICSAPIQEGLLSEAVSDYMSTSIAAAWFRLHPELKTAIDMDAERSTLNHITLMTQTTERPSHCY